MSRLTAITDQNANPAAAELFSAIKSKIGMVPNLYRVSANQPAVLKALLTLGENLSQGSLDAPTREAIALTVAGINTCDYCASAHSAISKSLKVDEAEIQSHLKGRSSNARLAAILAFASAVTHKRGLISDSDLQAARDGGLDDGVIVEVIGQVVANIFTNYLNHVADTEIDFPRVSAS